MTRRNILQDFCITVGYRCNFRCKHCVVADKKQVRLSSSEIKMLSEFGKVWTIKNVLFVGGEPTLYTEDINTILSGFPSSNRPRVKITTNGHFAVSLSGASAALNKFKYLDSVQLSYDRYHKKFLALDNVAYLFQACKELKKDFSIILTIQSPMDLTLIEQFRGMKGISVGVQKVHPTPTLNVECLRDIYPDFEPAVLSKRCPNLGKMVYLCGEGFSTCCSYLTRGALAGEVIHSDIPAHKESWFYKLISKNSFESIADKLSVVGGKMRPEYSSPCVLCEHIFSTAAKAGNLIIKEAPNESRREKRE